MKSHRPDCHAGGGRQGIEPRPPLRFTNKTQDATVKGWLSREQLRAVFDQAAELYDRARPGYPAQLVEELVQFAGIEAASRVLEVGCGTGQLTVPLAERGCQIVALDLGPNLAALARRNLARHPAARVIVAVFEDWPLPTEPFDAVVSATAFHWLDPAVRVSKAANALRPGGTLATIATHHVAGGDEDFFLEAQDCYARWDPSTGAGGLRLPKATDIPFDREELDRSGRFGPATFRRYAWEQAYSTAAYLELLLTYSGHRALPPEALRGLLDCIARLIDGRYNGKITKAYLSELRLAKRLPD
jgi:SAM-dependent methyltransferase